MFNLVVVLLMARFCIQRVGPSSIFLNLYRWFSTCLANCQGDTKRKISPYFIRSTRGSLTSLVPLNKIYDPDLLITAPNVLRMRVKMSEMLTSSKQFACFPLSNQINEEVICPRHSICIVPLQWVESEHCPLWRGLLFLLTCFLWDEFSVLLNMVSMSNIDVNNTSKYGLTPTVFNDFKVVSSRFTSNVWAKNICPCLVGFPRTLPLIKCLFCAVKPFLSPC